MTFVMGTLMHVDIYNALPTSYHTMALCALDLLCFIPGTYLYLVIRRSGLTLAAYYEFKKTLY